MRYSFRRRSNNPLDRLLLRADNTILNTGSGGDTIATDDISGVKHQRVKVQHGADGSATDVSAASPLPVDASGVAVPVTDNGGSLTVDGTVAVTGVATAANQLPDGHNVTVDNASIAVTAASLPLPTGAATAAGQLADGHSVALSATDNAVLDTIATNTTGLNNCVSGTELQVDIVSGGTGSTQYAEDSVHTTGDTGTMTLAVRNDTLAALAGTDGDYAPLQVNADGAMYVEVQNLGGTSNVDTAAGGTDSGAVTLAVRDDALTTLTPVDGDYTPLRVNSTGALHVTGGGGGTEYTVDAAAPATPTGTASLMERDDSLSTLTEVAGDWIQQRCDANGSLWVNANDDSVDSNNSSTTPLGISATYTGTGTEVLGYSSITVNIFADQDSATNGMRFEFSQDNTNWDKSHQHDYTASSGRTFQFTAQARYFRVVFVNGTTGQGAFRLQTLLHRQTSTTTIHRIDADLAPDRSATAVKSVIHAQAGGSGDFTPIQSTAGGNLNVSIAEISDGLDIGAGNAGAETQRVSISTDDVNLASINTDAGTIAGAVSGTEMQVDVVAALPAGTNNIGDVDIASALPAGTNNIGDVDVATIAAGSNLVGDVGLSGARTSGGTTLYKNIDVDESEDQVKGTAGQVYWVHAINVSATTKYLKFYNATAASVTVGTTVPDLTFPVPANSTTGAGFVLSVPNGIAFGTAITIAATTGVADNDSGAPGANEVIVNLGYA